MRSLNDLMYESSDTVITTTGVTGKPIRQYVAVPIGNMGTGPTDLVSVTSSTKHISIPMVMQSYRALPDAPQGLFVQGVTTDGITATIRAKWFETYAACTAYNGSSESNVVYESQTPVTVSGSWRQRAWLVFDASKFEHAFPYCRLLITYSGSGTVYIKTDYAYIGVAGEV